MTRAKLHLITHLPGPGSRGTTDECHTLCYASSAGCEKCCSLEPDASELLAKYWEIEQ